MVMRILFLCLALLLPGLVQAAELEARVDRDSLQEGETFLLELRGRDVDASPDTTPLERDFEIVQSAQSNNLSIVNGRVDRHTLWRYTLSPRRSGKLTIPALSAGSVQSTPLHIEVTKYARDAGGREHRDVFLEVDVSPPQPWVGAQVIYRVRLFAARALAEGTLSSPAADDLEVQTLGEDLNYEAMRGVRRYRVLERRFALFPQRSGKYLITPPALTARYRDDPGAGLFANRNTLRLRADRLALDVQPRPSNYSGNWWLPARSLAVAGEWQGDVAQARVGEPIVRKITLQAAGLPAAQLPALEAPLSQAFKIYPDKPELDDQLAGEAGLRGTRVESWAVLPTQAGELTLPELRIPWWNSAQGREEVAVLPAVTVTVAAAVAPVAAPVAPPAAAPVAPASAPWALWLFAGAGWLSAVLFALMWWRRRRQARAALLEEDQATLPEKVERSLASRKAHHQLGLACENGDVPGIERALLEWARANRPQAARSLLALAEQLAQEGHAKLSVELRALDAARYRKPGDVTRWRTLPQRLRGLAARESRARLSAPPQVVLPKL